MLATSYVKWQMTVKLGTAGEVKKEAFYFVNHLPGFVQYRIFPHRFLICLQNFF